MIESIIEDVKNENEIKINDDDEDKSVSSVESI